MAKERKASVIYEGNASQLVYAFPFDYLRKKFVKVEDVYTNITELTIGVDYTVEDKQVRLVKGIPIGHSVKIYRETTTDPLVEWQDASVLRSADLSLQEVQLLHLAEETADKVFDSGMSTAYDNPNCWDGQYKRIINALDPIEDGDVVTLRYIKANQDSLLNQLKSTGAAQNASIVSTGDSQNARLTSTGDTQNTRLNTTGDTQDKRLNALGQKYVDLMTTLKDTATTKATEASNSAELSKKWAMSDTSPDGVSGNKSSKTWAEEAKTSASNSAASASASQSSANASSASATQSANSASASKSSANASASSASASASSASAASTSAGNAKTSETNAANSARAAKQSEENAKTWDPTMYLAEKALIEATEVSNPAVTIPNNHGLYPIVGYPTGSFDTAANKPEYRHGLVMNFKGQSKEMCSLYSAENKPYLYFRTGYGGWAATWYQLATTNYVDNTIPKKTSQLTNDSGYATTETVDAEVQKWKKAYNNLRKRSYPTAFDEDELTVLMSTPINSGTITLSQPYTDFDGLLFIVTNDNGHRWQRLYISTATLQEQIKDCQNDAAHYYYSTCLFNGAYFWRIFVDDAHKFSETSFPVDEENCVIQKVYGVKFKNIE